MIQTDSDQETGRRIASMLLEIQAVKFNLEQPFVWASGWQSPIYCDNRMSLGFPETRSYIKESLSRKIRLKFPECEAIAGVATAGIPQGALVADLLKVPFLYVRAKPKGHGLENLIEGYYSKQQRVVVMEDLISTGGSSLQAIEALRNAEIQVLGLISIFTYGFDLANERFQASDVPWFSLSNYHQLIEVALQKGLIHESQLTTLRKWREQPDQWHSNS